MSGDRRCFSRVDFVSAASLTIAGNRYPVQLLNLSLQGCLLKVPELSHQAVEVGVIRFQLSGSGLELCFQGSLVHRNGDYLGYRFEQMELESLMHLRTLLEYNLGDPAQIEREVYRMFDS